MISVFTPNYFGLFPKAHLIVHGLCKSASLSLVSHQCFFLSSDLYQTCSWDPDLKVGRPQHCSINGQIISDAGQGLLWKGTVTTECSPWEYIQYQDDVVAHIDLNLGWILNNSHVLHLYGLTWLPFRIKIKLKNVFCCVGVQFQAVPLTFISRTQHTVNNDILMSDLPVWICPLSQHMKLYCGANG